MGSRKYFAAGIAIFLGLLVSGLILSIVLSWGSLAGDGSDRDEEKDWEEVVYGPVKEEHFTRTGILYEDQDPNKEVFQITKKCALIYMEVSLRWTDE
ncbi:MAG: hypothetical protein ACMUHB_06920, partial [Thermoplasmatota archaeon]